MRVKNVEAEISIKSILTIIILSFFLLCFIVGLIIALCFRTPEELFQEYINLNDIEFQICIILLPILLICGINIELTPLKNDDVDENSLKYADFFNNKINFYFENPQYNISCKYEDIENIDVMMFTTKITENNIVKKHHKKSKKRNTDQKDTKLANNFISIDKIIYVFTLLNGETIALNSPPTLRPMHLISKIHYYISKKVNTVYTDISKFTNSKKNISEIDCYLEKNYNAMLSMASEYILNLIPILFFVLSELLFVFLPNSFLQQYIDHMRLIILTPIIIALCISFGFYIFINTNKETVKLKLIELIKKLPYKNFV